MTTREEVPEFSAFFPEIRHFLCKNCKKREDLILAQKTKPLPYKRISFALNSVKVSFEYSVGDG